MEAEGPYFLSPIGFLGRFSKKSLESLGFPRKMRKRHAEMTKPSEKYGIKDVSLWSLSVLSVSSVVELRIS
jgi:hypothetical protein